MGPTIWDVENWKTKGVFFMLTKDSFHLTNFRDAIKYWKM